MTTILFSFILATALLAITPGPDNIFVLTQSMVYGKKYGLATVVGLMTGCIVHTTLVAFGVSAILKQNENLFLIVKLFGVCYLLYLAYNVYKSSSNITLSTTATEEKSVVALFKTGFLMNVLNPKVTIFFLAFFPQFLFSESLSTVYQFYVLGMLFIVVSFIIFSLVVLLAGTVSTYIKQHKAVGLYLKWMQITVFIAIALWLLVD